MQADIEAYLRHFTNREGALLAKVTERGLALPERLRDWRFWIGDSVIYLNDLNDFIEANPTAEAPNQPVRK